MTMKKILALLVLMLILISASDFKSDKKTSFHSIEGTWELRSFYNYDGENVTDTVLASDGYRQVKMYHNGKIMWSRYVPKDKTARFGYGSYIITNDQLIETIEFGDNQMMNALDTMRVFTFELQLDKNSYSQISQDEEGKRTFSENYKRID